MPVLRPITSHAEVLAYHRFRYSVYASSAQRGFLSGPEGFDTDEFDASALHLGWYEGDVLVGCVRLLNPIKSVNPLHFFKDLSDPELRERADKLLFNAKTEGQPLCEVSRLCLAPEHRSMAAIKRFVLEIIATAHRFGKDHCLFTCDASHAAFWQRMGFAIVAGFEGYSRPRTAHPGFLLQGNYHELLSRHRAELQCIGFQQVARMPLAA